MAKAIAMCIPRENHDPQSQKLYDASRKIKGSKWHKGMVMAPMAQYNAVKDFAEMYDYQISVGAAKRIAEYVGKQKQVQN